MPSLEALAEVYGSQPDQPGIRHDAAGHGDGACEARPIFENEEGNVKEFFEVMEKCPDCKGTGLYVGMAEKSGAAVVCYTCKGTGCKHYRHEYEPFTKREDTPIGISRVFQVNPGICIGAKDDAGLSAFGGMPIKEWESGLPFLPGMEDRLHTCPAWFYQSADYSKKPNWEECGWGMFSACKNFPCKSFCWEKWDAYFGKRP
jgi:hypothetical protein